jgi:ureidoglycolate lyase
MGEQVVERRKITIKEANTENFSPFGQILGPDPKALANVNDFYEGSVQITSPVNFISDNDTCISLATLQPRKLELKYMERHFKHTQTFIPLNGAPFVGVFGVPTTNDMPDLDQITAFRFDGTVGFTMNIGTWHEFPFAIQPDTNLVVILRNETNKNLSSENVQNDEAFGDDLDKKNLLKRTGILFELTH